MLHKQRRWNVSKKFESIDKLVNLLKDFNWTLCSGFLVSENIFLLNDSISEDSIEEYAVVIKTDCGWVQHESYTIGWMDKETLTKHIDLLLTSDVNKLDIMSNLEENFEQRLEFENHTCYLCR